MSALTTAAPPPPVGDDEEMAAQFKGNDPKIKFQQNRERRQRR